MKLPIAFTLLTSAVFLLPLKASCHLEPPKTIHERSEMERERVQIKTSLIQSAIIWNYTIDSSGRKERRYPLSKLTYDQSGNLTKQIVFSETGTEEQSISYIWSESNDMLEQIKSDPKKGIEQTKFVYDSIGTISLILDYDSASLLTDWFVYSRDDGKNTITAIKYARDSTLIYSIRYKYEAGSSFMRLIEIEQWNSKGDRETKILNKIDGEKRTERQYFLSNGSIGHTFKYSYTNEGEFKEIVKDKADGTIDFRRIYEYDKLNNLILQTEYDKSGTLKKLLEFEYDYYPIAD